MCIRRLSIGSESSCHLAHAWPIALFRHPREGGDPCSSASTFSGYQVIRLVGITATGMTSPKLHARIRISKPSLVRFLLNSFIFAFCSRASRRRRRIKGSIALKYSTFNLQPAAIYVLGIRDRSSSASFCFGSTASTFWIRSRAFSYSFMWR
jgi:hypothetical protein